MTRFTRSLCAALAAALLALAAASDAGGQALEPTLPDTPAGEQMAWVVEASRAPYQVDYEGKISPDFNDGNPAPPERIRNEFARIESRTAGLDVMALDESDEHTLTALARSRNKNSWWLLHVVVEPEAPHAFLVLRTVPVLEEPKGGSSNWGSVDFDLTRPQAPSLSSWRAERLREDGGPRVLYGRDEASRTPIGTAARLFVVCAAAEAIAAGEAGWDDQVAFDPALRTIPDGPMSDAEAGETFTLRRVLGWAARGGNTAADHLLHRLGRERVERFAASVQGERGPNTPFMAMGEFYKLKLSDDDALVEKAAGDDARAAREALDALADLPAPDPEDADAVTTPTRLMTVQWFASAEELAQIMRRLNELMEREDMAPLRETLNQMNRRERAVGVWPFLFRVAGSEPGATTEVYLMERRDGPAFVLAAAMADPSTPLDQRLVRVAVNNAIAMLATGE